jgi:hypothetical protein
MAVEPRRGCGFRKVGGLYLICAGLAAPCDRLPIPLGVCPCCGGGIKQTRGWTWIQPARLFGGKHDPCGCRPSCPACDPDAILGEDGRAGLLWIGEQFYPSPADFAAEAARLGVSRRISAVPRGFKVGETWIFVAHPKAVQTTLVNKEGESLFAEEPGLGPGIFQAFRPSRIERIVKQSELEHYQDVLADVAPALESGAKLQDLVPASYEVFWRLRADVARGITLVPVPDDDPDHLATYRAEKEEL